MKNYLKALLATVVCIISINAMAEDRIYIHSKDIVVAENGIFINYDNHYMLVNGIKCDDQGIYFLSEQTTGILDDKYTWICRNGHYVHRVSECPICHDKQRKD